MTHRRLSAFPQPYPDELLSSWVERIGLFFGTEYETWLSSLMSQAGEFPSPLGHDVDCDPLIRGLMERLTRGSRRALPQTLDESDADVLPWPARVAYCARCWDDDVVLHRQPFVRRQWACWHRVTCPTHRTFLSARRRFGWRTSQGVHAWEPVWRTRAKWARSFDIAGDAALREDALSYSPGRYSRFTPAQIAELDVELERLGAPDGERDATRSADQDGCRRAERALALVMSTGFNVVSDNMRSFVLSHRGVAALRDMRFDDIMYSGMPHQPSLLENRMSVLVTAAEVLRMMEGRPPINCDVVSGLVQCAGRHGVLDNAETSRQLLGWPVNERRCLLNRLGNAPVVRARRAMRLSHH